MYNDGDEKPGNQRKGMRCKVCTGCGVCPGVMFKADERMHILTDGILESSSWLGSDEKLFQKNKARLVTADIGTTTIAMILYGEDGKPEDRYLTVNPQTKYGDDVISRILAAEDCTKAKDMQKLVWDVLQNGMNKFRKKLPDGETMQMIVAANTTMNYLLLGRNPKELGTAPFRARFLQAEQILVGGVQTFLFPGISAFVGGDIVAGIYASGMHLSEEITLLVDLGTNGEIVLGNKDRRIACSTAAGPAFEGGVNRGIWGSDMITLLAALRREGILDENGILEDAYLTKGVRVGNVCVTKEAVRSIQLAKSAIATGIEVLLDKYGIDLNRVDRVILAGGFGYYIKAQDAREIGLLQNELLDKIIIGGNTALEGARLLGRRMDLTDEKNVSQQTGILQQLVSGTECLNLAEVSKFEESYLRHMRLCPFEI